MRTRLYMRVRLADPTRHPQSYAYGDGKSWAWTEYEKYMMSRGEGTCKNLIVIFFSHLSGLLYWHFLNMFLFHCVTQTAEALDNINRLH